MLCGRVIGDSIPGTFHFTQQVGDFVQQCRIAIPIGFYQTALHIDVEIFKVTGDLSAFLMVQTGFQPFKDRDGPLAAAILPRAPSMSICIRRCGVADSIAVSTAFWLY